MTVELRLRLPSNEPMNSLKSISYKFDIYADGAVVGVRSFTPLTARVAKTGVVIYGESRRRGYAYASMRAMIDLAWAWDFETLITGVHATNKYSQSVLFKSGFRVDAITKETDGEYYQCRLERSWSVQDAFWFGPLIPPP
jgi:RimJ/RimL family protein N-acetyltransferase